ncbi:MAG: pentapeptide repeat-containing protein, partial [Methylophilus sp.]
MNPSLALNEYRSKIDTIEVLHLDALGYGPEGKHTRLQWRAECLQYLLKGKQAFVDWQDSWLEKAKQNTNRVDFTIRDTTSDNGVTNSFEVTDKTNPCALDFSGQKFENSLHLEGFHFLHEAIFSYARFEMHTYFDDVIFKDKSTFRGVAFQTVHFDKANFKGGVDFSEASFGGGTSSFTKVRFKSRSNFNSATFISKAVFRKTIFKSHAWFRNAKFIDSASFENAIFRGAIYFTDAYFFSRANFEKVEF